MTLWISSSKSLYVCFFCTTKRYFLPKWTISWLSSLLYCLYKTKRPHFLTRWWTRGSNLSIYPTALAVTKSYCSLWSSALIRSALAFGILSLLIISLMASIFFLVESIPIHWSSELFIAIGKRGNHPPVPTSQSVDPGLNTSTLLISSESWMCFIQILSGSLMAERLVREFMNINSSISAFRFFSISKSAA